MFGQPTYGSRVYGGGPSSGFASTVAVYLHKAYFKIYMSFRKVFEIRI